MNDTALRQAQGVPSLSRDEGPRTPRKTLEFLGVLMSSVSLIALPWPESQRRKMHIDFRQAP
jgi:hypothetical protein